MKNNFEKQSFETLWRNPDSWKAGIFYFNRKDPRIIVPKKNPKLGWTLNFGHKAAWIGFVMIILIIVAFEIWD